MTDDLHLNVPLLRRRVPNLTVAARAAGLRAATVSDLCNGKIPLGRAEVKTLVALADLAGCSLDELVLRGPGVEMIETGMKVLDLFAPLVRGGSVGLVARTGVGQMLVLQELIHRLKQRAFATVLWLPAGETDPHLQREVAAEAEAVGATPDEVYAHVKALGAGREVLLAADRVTVLSGELEGLRERLREAGVRPVTFALVDARGEAPDEEVPYGPLETLWRFDPSLAVRSILPAVNPEMSTSTLLEGSHLDATHLTVQQRARKLLRRYHELIPVVQVRGLDRLPAADVQTYRRGERLEAFLTQPAYVAEPWTKMAGQWVTPAESIDGVRRILDGAADEMEVNDLKWQGALGQAPARG